MFNYEIAPKEGKYKTGLVAANEQDTAKQVYADKNIHEPSNIQNQAVNEPINNSFLFNSEIPYFKEIISDKEFRVVPDQESLISNKDEILAEYNAILKRPKAEQKSAIMKLAGRIAKDYLDNNPVYKEPGTPLIVLDAGHGGKDSGAVKSDVKESGINTRVALKLHKQLKSMGFDTADTDSFRQLPNTLSLYTRQAFRDLVSPDLFVSIHADKSRNIFANGMRVYYLDENDKEIADLFKCQAVQGDFCVIRDDNKDDDINIPSVLIETGFMSNFIDFKRLNSEKGQAKIVSDIVSSLKPYLSSKTTPNPFNIDPFLLTYIENN